MIEVTIPGFRHLRLQNLVLDYNGTLAVDGQMIEGVKRRLCRLAEDLQVHVVTADTFGKTRAAVADINCTVEILSAESQAEAKRDYVRRLNADETVCIGNGRNDRLMLQEAGLGIAVILGEGAHTASVTAADVVCTSIIDALELLQHPLRLTATLRS
jgi:soluble P-type ATPase